MAKSQVLVSFNINKKTYAVFHIIFQSAFSLRSLHTNNHTIAIIKRVCLFILDISIRLKWEINYRPNLCLTSANCLFACQCILVRAVFVVLLGLLYRFYPALLMWVVIIFIVSYFLSINGNFIRSFYCLSVCLSVYQVPLSQERSEIFKPYT